MRAYNYLKILHEDVPVDLQIHALIEKILLDILNLVCGSDLIYLEN